MKRKDGKPKEYTYSFCDKCNKTISNFAFSRHYKSCKKNSEKEIKSKKTAWNKGLTKNNNEIVKRISAKNAINFKGIKKKPLTEEVKKILSEKMKKAHKEGRAWNIGKSRWNNKKSYPEEFFSKVIENEFQDKEYICEHPFLKYSIDFAWVNKKLAIEIDGEQHERFPEYKARDKEKDRLLLLHGWKVLRIKWKDMYNDTKAKIKEAYNFIHD